MVDVAAAAGGYVVGEELDEDYFEDGQRSSWTGDVDDVLDGLGNVFVAFGGGGADAGGAGGDFLDVGEGFS